jgi:DNA topoisomerase-1
MTKLLIVESPAKCKKIQGYLGAGWRVQATMGHIRALKEDLDAIGFKVANGANQNWAPIYEAIDAKKSAIASLRSAAKGAEVYLGADDDREGEAIAWHACVILGLPTATTPRVVFHEITESALKAAVANPRTIDFHKVHAQQARSMLDMLIGFTLSPCLWRGVGNRPGLSAGRCQTPALRIIYDRDRAIEDHAATNTWRISATTEDIIEDSTLEWRDDEHYETQEAADAVLRSVLTATTKSILITDRAQRVSTSQPPKPFITSTLQQEAHSRLGMAPKTTMKAAQTLYEGGHITYMRTDNAILSQEAIEAASAVVRARWGEDYLGGIEVGDAPVKKRAPPKKKTAAAAPKPEAQAAHEGIRPTHMEVETGDQLEGMGANERRLYELIWRRSIQSVMAAEKRDVVRLTGVPHGLDAPKLTTAWEQVAFAGWRILDYEKKDAAEQEEEANIFESRADLTPQTLLDWSKFIATEVRSAPPARFTEASLIRELEHRGIGRPSTYATLVETVLEREYVEKATIPASPVTLKTLTLTPTAKAPKQTERTEKVGGEKDKLRTTALGRTVIEWLLSNFGDMIEYDFTAAMESQLDEVAKGSRLWVTVLTEAWSRYADRYTAVMASPPSPKAGGGGGKVTDFGDGYKLVISKKGPLFVLERDGEKTRFANVPPTLSATTATRADAEAAFAAATQAVTGETIGELEGAPVVRHTGRYGPYVTWMTPAKSVTMNCTADDTLETLTPKLQAKVSGDAVDHTVGAYKIKRGPYGLYMFKTGSKTKPTFVSIPDSTTWGTLTPEGAEELYKHCAAAKKEVTASRAKKPAAEKKEPAARKPRAKKSTD